MLPRYFDTNKFLGKHDKSEFSSHTNLQHTLHPSSHVIFHFKTDFNLHWWL